MSGLYLGLISGTSADAIDVALARFTPRPQPVACASFPYPAALRERILALSQADGLVSLDEFGEIDTAIGAAFAAAANQLLQDHRIDPATVSAIGSHGQTLRHRPRGPHPFTLQAGDPNVIAERTGIAVVADFRRRDVAAGGQGAPLLPALHAACFSDPGEPRAALNLGGIANLTLLPAQGDVRGFDTGPANCLLDAWSLRERGTARDEGGAWARSGRVNGQLLQRLLAEPWFALPPPKSTGRDVFHLDWMGEALRAAGNVAAQDVQATLVELTARTVTDALRAAQPGTRRVIACGGGVHNAFLMERLAASLAPATLDASAAFGVDPDFVEAIGFAWLAHQTLSARPGNIATVTGARGPRVLGAIYSG